MKYQSILAKIPSVHEIDQVLLKNGLKHGLEVRKQILDILDKLRSQKEWLIQDKTTRESILDEILERIGEEPTSLVPLINATGTIIHTNLGRSILSEEIFEAAKELCINYTNLEFSLKSGKRGQRIESVKKLLQTLCVADDAVIVNNNAAAVLLSLSALAKGREVIISRGELVEIGGSFRIPEIIAQSGAKIREVGTTNRTHLYDYERAISEDTAVILKVHCSNYRIEGFKEEVSVSELSGLAKKHNLILINDVGSGSLGNFGHPQLNKDPVISQVLKNGADLVTFSGDKLLGGPQAGIAVGKKAVVAPLKNHPLYRALRSDKITIVFLEKTLQAISNQRQNDLIPTQRMLNETLDQVKKRAGEIHSGLNSPHARLVACRSTPGGGALPGETIDSWGIQISHPDKSENKIIDLLRYAKPPVIARVSENKVILDARTVLPSQIQELIQAVKSLW